MGVKPFPRQGAFVALDKKVGIIFEYPQLNYNGEADAMVPDASSAEVHFMDAKGETTEQVRNVPVRALTQAKLSQLPAKRRPTEAQAKRFGYRS